MGLTEYRAADWDRYKMDYHKPFVELEPLADEIRVVDGGLGALHSAELLAFSRYDGDKFLALRRAVAERYEIPWTAITPRMQRLIWAINAIHRPAVMIAAGVFCGNTFTCNAGAAVGPGAVYAARALVGLEIKPEEAVRANRNVGTIDSTGVARVIAADAVPWCVGWKDEINLLYLDADGDRGRGKAIYLEIAEAAWDKMPAGSLLLAHNSVNAAEKMKDYLRFVRDARNCRASVNMIVDGEGLEVSRK